ncbi:Sec-independent protein translocase protein TatB [Pantoea sp. Nvir]|uniref:Sec-independent protein translocase protein TatB n=1 Tax=Pantoea sp. Nvir TaxID=2576760 RepID=UPI00135938F7|nr:Sec-independent protein translocase protein TatB [Pantoea sp. Nvir]MXP66975.1 Sec-independent protein translocase subunit TatB [Pantoea sp. Nvir]CAJ0992553.1 Sec-independent protein translocase protein TatB [Pantoea sp. Nvir]
MFDINFSELVLVFVIGLIFLGPQRLPVAIKTVLGWIRAIRSLAANVQHELAQELKLQELQDSLKKVEEMSCSTTTSPELKKSMEEMRKTADSMKRAVQQRIDIEKAEYESHTRDTLCQRMAEHVTPLTTHDMSTSVTAQLLESTDNIIKSKMNSKKEAPVVNSEPAALPGITISVNDER